MNDTKIKDKEYIASTYNRFCVEIVDGKGSLCYDETGKEYIDLTSGIGVNSFGFCDEIWQNAINEQIKKFQHTSNLYYTKPCADLAEMLCNKTGMKKVFFSNSGAEANECAIKAARKYAADKKGAEYNKIVTLTNSFHGRTLTTLAATGQDHYHELFNPLTPGFYHIDANDELYELEVIASREKIAAVMIECIQGEGGVVALKEDFVKKVYDYCQKRDIIFIVDEVQTGNGRTGKLYSYMNFGIKPDIVTTAKGLGGGLPIGATLLGDKVKDVFGFGDHGSTFGGNPISASGAISILKRIDDAFLNEVLEKSQYVFNELQGSKGIKSVSGMGLMIGIETVRPASEVINECIKKGVLCLSAKSKVRLLPALNIKYEQLQKAISIIKEVCSEYSE